MSEFRPIDFFCEFVLRNAGVVNYVKLSTEAHQAGLRRGAAIALRKVAEFGRADLDGELLAAAIEAEIKDAKT